ncbi:hypothetical protein EAX61_04305 [Dokdonia sinensis]|uniref:Uncharacterized protein n=1 Tax=Dokdonia sinensis TaxID=2479847 RepID=A0A3M0GET9_9FLAO|nr:hypothetical protein [Dokdonia sinensis]RMB62808.1 hypothetical protein EAX61_04305 [Dokdonia sinensis]
MKILKNIKTVGITLATAAVLIGTSSCTEEEKFPLPFGEIGAEIPGTLPNGAFLKTIESSFTVDLFNLDGSTIDLLLEARDSDNGNLLQDVDVFVAFADLTLDDDNGTPDDPSDDPNFSVSEVMLETIPGSAFTAGPDGFPRVSYNSSVTDAIDALSLDPNLINGADTFTYRFELNLTDGTSWSSTNSNPNIATELFFSSPFQYTTEVVCLFEADDFFSGTYLMEELLRNDNPFQGGFGDHYPDAVLVDITADGTQRFFDFTIYPDSFVFAQQATINLICGKIFFTTDAAPGGSLGCTGGANTIQDIHAQPQANFDLNLEDDDVFEFDVSGFGLDDGGCGTGSYPMRLRFTKQ